MDSHSCVAWKEGAEKGLRSDEKDKLVIPSGGRAGGVAMRMRPGLADCSKGHMSVMDGTQSCHTLLYWVHEGHELV